MRIDNFLIIVWLPHSFSLPFTELLGIEVKAKSVVEIDDGLAPCFFFKTEEGYTRCRSFDAERARANRMEGWEEYYQEDMK